MIFVQIILGGITRLTGSGLSITKWDIVTGTIPPLNASDWNREFDLYKQTPQYRQINAGMSLQDFKFIYFWEYLHRLWARSIGFVFLFPFAFFVFKNWIDKELYKQLAIAVLLGAFVATFGWIMVASGLVHRPWVNAYKLTIHLNLALILYAWMVWIALNKPKSINTPSGIRSIMTILSIIVVLQFILGGLMSGMKAGLYYPTWPDMHGEFFPKVLTDNSLWTIDSVVHYERGLIPGLVQFTHRSCAYFIFITALMLLWRIFSRNDAGILRKPVLWFNVVVLLQICLGILTVINSIGRTPLVLGVAHQGMAIVLLTSLIYIHRNIHK